MASAGLQPAPEQIPPPPLSQEEEAAILAILPPAVAEEICKIKQAA